MHICLVTNTNYLSDPKARAYVQQLQGVGHKVSVVGIGKQPKSPSWLHLFTDELTSAPGSTLLLRRPAFLRRSQRNRSQLLTEEAAKLQADLYVALSQPVWPMAAAAARENSVPVIQPPGIGDPTATTLVQRAPLEPELSKPITGIGWHHTPGFDQPPSAPEADRWKGKRVALCYRKTERSPGRYLEDALVHAGAEVELHTESVNLTELDQTADLIVFIESPNPPLQVVGEAIVTPVLFWVHHGEHHLAPNTRLASAVGADGVLLAHSWHLAHHFAVPVHRFPFGAAVRDFDPSLPHKDRPFDVALVGARLFGAKGPYGARQEAVASLQEHFSHDRLAFREGISPIEMADLYARSKIVLNDGGTRHFPITMRVLEAVASGAVLLSEHAPGIEVLLEEGTHYRQQTGDIVQDVTDLLDHQQASVQMAEAALEHVMNRHTYDHRVDELFEIAGATTKAFQPIVRKVSALANCISGDPSVQRIAQFGAPDLASEIPTREIAALTELPPGALAANKMEAVALVSENPQDHLELLRSARRFIYYEGGSDFLVAFVAEERPSATVQSSNGVIRVDLRSDGYTLPTLEGRS